MSSMHGVTTVSIILNPTPEQDERLKRHAGYARVLWNSGIAIQQMQPYEVSSLTGSIMVLTSAEFAEEWNDAEIRAEFAPWAAGAGLSTSVEAATFTRLSDYYANEVDWPRPIERKVTNRKGKTRRTPLRFDYDPTGVARRDLYTLYLDGVGYVATLTDVPEGVAFGGTVRQEGRGGNRHWVIDLNVAHLDQHAPAYA